MIVELAERALFFLLGGGIGFILGYIVARLREIKEELHEVDEFVKENLPSDPKQNQRGEIGFMRYPLVADLMLVLVLCLTVYAAFASQVSSNQVEAQQDRQKQVTECNQEFLNKTIVALNERTSFTVEQTEANVDVQRAQADFFLGLYEHPADDELELKLFKEYSDALQNFVKASKKNVANTDDYPYATPKELQACLDNKLEELQDE